MFSKFYSKEDINLNNKILLKIAVTKRSLGTGQSVVTALKIVQHINICGRKKLFFAIQNTTRAHLLKINNSYKKWV